MGKKFVFLHLSKSMDWLKSGLDWFKSVRESSLDSADDASEKMGAVPLVCHTVTWCIPIEKLYLVDQI